MSVSPAISVTAAELRAAFDHERTIPFSTGDQQRTESLIGLRVSGDAYALRVSEVTSLCTDRKIVSLPRAVPGLLGVAGIRAVVVPVYSIAALLGYADESSGVRWLALCGVEEPIALAFSGFEGYTRVLQSQLHPAEKNDAARTFVTHVARAERMVRAVVSIPLFRKAIQERCRNASVPKER